MLPPAFRSARMLQGLNVTAIGLGLGVVTSALFGYVLGDLKGLGFSTLVFGLPTLLVGLVWALLLRWRATMDDTGVRWGWLLSPWLAVLHAGLIWGLLVLSAGSIENLPASFWQGMTVEAFVWVPALPLMVLVFGLPLALTERLSKRGMTGAERGEVITGLTASILCLGSLLGIGDHLLRFGHTPPALRHFYETLPLPPALQLLGPWLFTLLGLLGLAAGATTTALALSREYRRRRFVRDAEVGELPGYRVDATAEGKVLVRVASPDEHYRAADSEEDLFALDEEGLARAPLRAAGE